MNRTRAVIAGTHEIHVGVVNALRTHDEFLAVGRPGGEPQAGIDAAANDIGSVGIHDVDVGASAVPPRKSNPSAVGRPDWTKMEAGRRETDQTRSVSPDTVDVAIAEIDEEKLWARSQGRSEDHR